MKITRDAVAGDILSFYGRTAPQTLRARVLERDGEVIGIAGYYVLNGHALVFSDNREGIPKMTIWREAVKFMADLKLPAICLASEDSGAFLKRLGWRHVEGETYQWPV